MMLAKACFSLELGFGQSRIYLRHNPARREKRPPAAQPASQRRRPTKDAPSQEFNRRGHENCSTRLVCCDLQGRAKVSLEYPKRRD